MEKASTSAQELRVQIAALESQLAELRRRLAGVEVGESQIQPFPESAPPLPDERAAQLADWRWPLPPEDYERYGRQLVLPSIGVQGQLRLRRARVLLVGAGGLGCPASAYLAGAGVGTVGLVDGDTVELSNLHRQIAHGTSRVGMSKVDSAITYLRELNPSVTYHAHREHLTPQNAEAIISQYDVVLDCTDHPTSRYLISDSCVLLHKPLVSASALRTDGQLMVLNTPAVGPDAGPCYRCVFPRPPPPDAVVSCGEGGILGPVVGAMGVLQALEAIKLIAAGRHLVVPDTATPPDQTTTPPLPPSLLLFSAGGPDAQSTFRTVRMRGRRKDCPACGPESTLALEALRSGSVDYVAFCGGVRSVALLQPDERVSVVEYSVMRDRKEPHLLLDVRGRELFEIASIDGAVNVPFSRIQARSGGSDSSQNTNGQAQDIPARDFRPEWIPPDLGDDVPIFVVCRVGNDSQEVTKRLKEAGLDRAGARFVGDIRGGMKEWKEQIDGTMPFM